MDEANIIERGERVVWEGEIKASDRGAEWIKDLCFWDSNLIWKVIEFNVQLIRLHLEFKFIPPYFAMRRHQSTPSFSFFILPQSAGVHWFLPSPTPTNDSIWMVQRASWCQGDLLSSLKAEIRSQISPRNAFTINHGVESSEKGRNLKSRMQIILFWAKLNQLAILINFTQNWLTNPVLCWQFILFTYIPPSPFHRLQQKIINKQTPGNKN